MALVNLKTRMAEAEAEQLAKTAKQNDRSIAAEMRVAINYYLASKKNGKALS